MIHSLHDEYDPITELCFLFSLAPNPKKLIEIDAVNHRFSNKVPEVLTQIERALLWLESL
jgi:hypothetical protein